MHGHHDQVRLWLIAKLEDTKSTDQVGTNANGESINAMEMWERLQDPTDPEAIVYIAQMYAFYQLIIQQESVPHV